jgi:hypothetical protein
MSSPLSPRSGQRDQLRSAYQRFCASWRKERAYQQGERVLPKKIGRNQICPCDKNGIGALPPLRKHKDCCESIVRMANLVFGVHPTVLGAHPQERMLDRRPTFREFILLNSAALKMKVEPKKAGDDGIDLDWDEEAKPSEQADGGADRQTQVAGQPTGAEGAPPFIPSKTA